tara:strand:+ start:1029 stop:2180 length:1152 start_codon:yes stop_codon:yes gene_type:complete
MDNIESIFRALRQQLESDMERINRRSQANNTPENEDDLILNYTNNILSDYLSVMRLHQETMSFFNLNMFSLIDIIRNEQTRRREELNRRLQRQRPNNLFTSTNVQPINESYRSTPSFNNVRNNRPFENNASTFFRNNSLFGISDISRNYRRSLPTLINPRLNSPLDARHFFGGLGPELRNVIVRPSNNEIENATRTFVYHSDADVFNTRCYITMDDFEEGDELCEILQCKHTFKKEPLMNWFNENVRCPVCRFDIRDYVQETVRESIDSFISSRQSSSQSLNEETETINNSNQSSPTHSESSNSVNENSTNTEPFFNTYLNDNLAQDVSNGINEILENLVNDISNNNVNPTLSYSLSVPLIYHEFFDTSNNLTFNNVQFNSSP